MIHTQRGRRAIGVLGAGVAVAALAVAGPAASVTSSAAASSSFAGHKLPGVGITPIRHKAGTIDPSAARPNDVLFGCQEPGASFVCYGPQQIRTAYGFDNLYQAGFNGKGSTIVIVDAYRDPVLSRDLKTFDDTFGLPPATLSIVQPDGHVPFDANDAVQAGWAGEISLDVQYSHAIAPQAKIVLVEARTSTDSDIGSALQYVADNNLGDVVSQSFGEAESCLGVNSDGTRQPGVTLKASHAIYQQMADEGMTVFASSGDQGAAQPTCDGNGYKLAVSTPASDPLVTGVGGTKLFADPDTGVYDHEIAWNETQAYGAAGGGGFSAHFAKPDFQKQLGDLPSRGVPDVSYNAAINHGVLVAFSLTDPVGTFYVFGGTSAGSPQWAALAAISVQLNGGRIGDINPSLYRMPKDAFTDITHGNNRYGHIEGYTTGTGWDAVTGLGTPRADHIAYYLAGTNATG
jgi:subtilase family serine protease